MENSYAVLGLQPCASLADVRAAYKQMALLTHPDKGGCKDTFQTVVCAFEKICSYHSRSPEATNLRKTRQTSSNRQTADRKQETGKEDETQEQKAGKEGG